MKKLILLVTVFTLLAGSLYAGSIAGKVTAKESGKALIGANVYLKGTTLGAATDEDGMYYIKVDDGDYTVVCDYVGFAVQQKKITVKGDTKVDFKMTEYLFAKTIEVMADRAIDRVTPVAYSNVDKEQMEVQLGSRDIPMVMNTTPSVYATQQGGGAGDARVNVRGFNQRNVAIMINGVPVNDMENGWVYWSNWDGVGDATASIQMQRGLSAVNLATPSIGGTMNIITDPTAQKAGFSFKQEFGTGAFLKSTLQASSGMIADKFAFNALVVRKTGDGQIDKTWTDSWAYYFGASWNINEDNRLELYAIGAPQRHGQNLYKQNIAAYDSTFAKSLDDYDPAATNAFKQSSAGRLYNENWGPVSSSYKGKQAVGSSTFDRHDPNFLNERENFYHKPQINLNYYSNLSNNLNLSTILYFSGGTGGGTGTYGRMKYNYHIGVPSPSRFVAWDATIDQNVAADSALGIIRNSRNDQYTFGAIAKLNWKANDNLKTTFGIDWRTAAIDHYREVRDLLGGKYFYYDGNDFDTTLESRRKGLGDKIAYNNTNTVDWIGGFAQAEYTLDKLSAYATAGYSMVKYSYTNHFKDDGTGNEFKLTSDNIPAFQVKGGVMYRISGGLDAYTNFGYVQKVPIFDNVIDDRNGVFANNPENEKFTSFEGGVNWSGLDRQLTVKGSFYYTLWQDRALPRSVETSPGVYDIFFLTGLNQTHMGVEFEAAYQPMRMFRLDLAGSVGNWKLIDDAKGQYRAVDSNTGQLATTTYEVAVKDLKIGDAPQTQVAIAGTVFPVKGLMARIVYKYFANYYSDWSPESRIVFDGGTPDRGQSWQIPNYGVMDFHGSYLLPFDVSGVKFKLFAHVFNVLDNEYVQDALDNSKYNAYKVNHQIVNPHKADAAEVFLGQPRFFNVGLSIVY